MPAWTRSNQSPVQQHMVWPWSWGWCWGGPVWVIPGGDAGSCCLFHLHNSRRKWFSHCYFPTQEVACWCCCGLLNKRDPPPPPKRSVRGAEEALLVDLLAQLQKQMKFSPKSHSSCCCWSVSGLLAPWQQLELKYCHMSINHRHTRWACDEMFLPHVESFKWLMEMRFWIYFSGRLTFLQSKDDNWC